MFVVETNAVRSITFFLHKRRATMAVFSAYNFFAKTVNFRGNLKLII